MTLRFTLALTVLAASGTVVADPGEQASQLEHGRDVFTYVCAPCHGRGPGTDGATMLPGTAALAAKYQGQVPPALEDRSGLTVDFLRHFIRNGSGAMPMFRNTEVSDADIEAIAIYLGQSSQADD